MPQGAHRRRLSIGLQVALGVIVVVGVAAALLYFVLSGRAREQVIEAKVRAATTVTEILSSSLAAPLDFEDEDAIGSELTSISARRDVQWAGVFDQQGKLIKELSKERAATPPEPRVGSRVLADRVEVTRPVVGRNGKELGTAAVVFSLTAENAAFEEIRLGILQICLLLGLGTSALLVILSRAQIVRPLERLAAAARDVEAGRTRTEVAVRSNDEVGDLAAAFNAMSAAVQDRETRLAQARDEIREILDNMGQAIVVFDRARNVGGVHAACSERMFGRPDLDGADVVTLLYPKQEPWEPERRAFVEWLDLAFSVGPDDWAPLAALAPSEVKLEVDGEPRVLEIELRPLFHEGAVEHVMVLATDATKQRELIEQNARRERELSSLRRVLSSAPAFVSLLESGRNRLARVRELFEGPTPSAAARTEAFQHLHMLRGEAQAFELETLASRAREAEDVLSRAERAAAGADAPLSQRQQQLLRAALEAAEQSLADAEQSFVSLSPTGKEILRQTAVDRGDLERLAQLVGSRDDELGRLVARLHTRPLGEVCATLPERAAAWAQAMGKRVRLEVGDPIFRVPHALARVLHGILTHLVRNAVAHGIERPEVRAKAGKEEVGLVRIDCSVVKNGVEIRVGDDGAGLADDPEGRGPDRIFEPGYTTALDETKMAGRGMGLAAARRDARTVGYDVVVAQQPGSGVTFFVVPLAAGAAGGEG